MVAAAVHGLLTVAQRAFWSMEASGMPLRPS